MPFPNRPSDSKLRQRGQQEGPVAIGPPVLHVGQISNQSRNNGWVCTMRPSHTN